MPNNTQSLIERLSSVVVTEMYHILLFTIHAFMKDYFFFFFKVLLYLVVSLNKALLLILAGYIACTQELGN